MKTVVAGALGECVHVAGVMNFLRLAEAAGWRAVFLGPAVPVDEVRVFPAHPPEFAHRPGFGFPPEWKVELSNEEDFQEAIPLRVRASCGQPR